ncbi:hypothetical protein CIL05_07055 [Virgibacillus profundi]|uniref:Uncharacterized protein n=1 Tax=Virgibacillus profundi TaxID=2024555 RepID=A0A2A2IFS1_9BACI|nr:hypothetical protein [Virgibacillus profundi]PAV30218.1 hypothetical protein CIL05_07055 [Virgibacillus profundi]PXY54390.1 hypothetical protein CIT14_07140 [Virgibacillus profundi]
MNLYSQLKQAHEKEVNSFPMKFAFSDDQFNQSMQELGLTKDDTDKVISIGAGGFIRKIDIEAYRELFARMEREHDQAIENDTTGTGFIKDMFKYELGNHEYGYTYEINDTLRALSLTYEEVKQSDKLQQGLKLATEECLQSVE